MSGIAEFYSDNLAHEVMKGLLQKAKSGGTIGKAPLGYLNIRRVVHGVEQRIVDFDPERAPLMRWAIEAYATGEWTIIGLCKELKARGLTTVPTAKRPAKAISVSQLHRFLRNSYYIGKVNYNGVEYDGRHEPLIALDTWRAVRDVLDSRSRKDEKQRTHNHYRKSTVYCGHCGSRLIVSFNSNRHGTVYGYFICLGRHQKRTPCTLKALRIETVEDRVAALHSKPWLAPAEAEALRQYLPEEFRRLWRGREDEQTASQWMSNSSPMND